MPPRDANGHISATANSIHLYSAHRAVIFALAQLSCLLTYCLSFGGCCFRRSRRNNEISMRLLANKRHTARDVTSYNSLSHQDSPTLSRLMPKTGHSGHFNRLIIIHCCHMGTGIKHTVPYRVKPLFIIFDIRTLWRSALSARVPGCQKLQMTA